MKESLRQLNIRVEECFDPSVPQLGPYVYAVETGSGKSVVSLKPNDGLSYRELATVAVTKLLIKIYREGEENAFDPGRPDDPLR